MGDIHQPLHVGGIFLDANNLPGADTDAGTIGGNALLLTPGKDADNLHHAWDAIDPGLGVRPTVEVIRKGCAVQAGTGPLLDRPAAWAGESIAAAGPAYANLSFVKDPTPHFETYWDVRFVDRNTYDWARERTQADRLLAGGVRLAEVLNAVWPSSKPAKPASRCER